MKIQFSRQHLVSCLSKVQPAIKANSPKEIYQHFRLFTKDGYLFVYASDGEMSIAARVQDTDSDVHVLLPSRIVRIVSSMSGDTVQIEIKNSSVVVSSNSAKVELQTVDVDEYPAFTSTFDDSVEFESGVLADAISRTVLASDEKVSASYAMGSILFACYATHTDVVATDARRLSVVKTAATTKNEFEALVSPRALSALVKCLDGGTVEFLRSANLVQFKTDDCIIETLQASGRFPRYAQVIPRQFNATVAIATQPLLSQVNLAGLIVQVEGPGIDFNLSNGNLTLSSQGEQVGKSEGAIPIAYDGETLEFTLVGQFVSQWLKVVDSETVELNVIDGNSAVVFVDGNNTYVVMPLSKDR